ncbi:MAG: Outer membrane protein assembly factor BamC [Cellvibrionales bacterium UBA7375]|nr:MAG: Outer membrane protein assembly factor BamC [Cellvibrionales bacterium UBA7375]
MNNISKLIMAACFTLSGCSWLGIEDNSNDYLLSPETQVLVVPEQLSASKLGQLYSIPPVSGDISTPSFTEVPRPQPVSVNTFEQLVKIQKIDQKRWILINNKPSELWPRVRNILNKNSIGSAKADGSSGVIETAWLSYNSDPDNVHRFRFTISPGLQLNSTEISVLHQLKSIDQEANNNWPASSHSDAKEQDMVSFLANQLVAQPDYASVSLLAQDIGGESKVEIIKPEVADPYILVNLSFDRTWASINYSAARGGFTLVDQDTTKGLLLVNYSDDMVEQESSGISSWFNANNKEQVLAANYRILVEQVESSIEIRIVSLEGDSLGKELALKLLNIVRSNMS